jgi:hypothetical protein
VVVLAFVLAVARSSAYCSFKSTGTYTMMNLFFFYATDSLRDLRAPSTGPTGTSA